MALDAFRSSSAGVVIDAPATMPTAEKPSPKQELVGWVMARVRDWRDVRDGAYKKEWDSYYRRWRGEWDPETKARKSERSKLISPASMMAVDLAVSEIVEGIFGRDRWFDVTDDLSDQEKADAELMRDQLQEDLAKDGVISQITQVVLNGALYGTGIAKIVTEVCKESRPRRKEDGTLGKVTEEIVKIYPVAVEPGQLVPDPAGTTIDEMLGVAVEMKVPLHKIKAKQAYGTYLRDAEVGGYWAEPQGVEQRKQEGTGGQESFALVTEWHGLVPKRMLAQNAAGDEIDTLLAAAIDDDDMQEAIVTIANEGALLRAIANPYVMEDRDVATYQHSRVPNRFWGRGVMEKARHPQSALDAEMRSRADSLAWTSNPMLAGDVTKLPARMDYNVWPGKFWPTKGDPREAITEFRFGDVNASTFQQTAELERQVQQATGALDSIMSIRGNIRDETAAGSAMAASGFIKRSKLTMFAIEGFLTTLIRRILWRKMQFDGQRYPRDFEFNVQGTVGMMARELETQLNVNLLQYVEQGSPPYLLILKSIYESSASPVRTELTKAIDAMLQPPDAEAQQKQKAIEQLQMQGAVEEVRNKQADTALKLANAGYSKAREVLTSIEADLTDDKLVLDNMKVVIDKEETRIMAEQNALSRDKLDVERQKVALQAKAANAG